MNFVVLYFIGTYSRVGAYFEIEQEAKTFFTFLVKDTPKLAWACLLKRDETARVYSIVREYGKPIVEKPK